MVGVSDVVCPGAAPGGGLVSHFNRGCGGFTAGWSYLYMRYLKLYPRSFGEHTRTISNSAVSAGSSPARAGTRFDIVAANAETGAHPRSRGDQA